MDDKTFDELTPAEQEDARRLAEDFLLNHPYPLHDYAALQALYQRSLAAFQVVVKRALLRDIYAKD